MGTFVPQIVRRTSSKNQIIPGRFSVAPQQFESWRLKDAKTLKLFLAIMPMTHEKSAPKFVTRNLVPASDASGMQFGIELRHATWVCHGVCHDACHGSTNSPIIQGNVAGCARWAIIVGLFTKITSHSSISTHQHWYKHCPLSDCRYLHRATPPSASAGVQHIDHCELPYMKLPAPSTEISLFVYETGVYVTKNDLKQTFRSNRTEQTRSSAVAERPRDEHITLKFC